MSLYFNIDGESKYITKKMLGVIFTALIFGSASSASDIILEKQSTIAKAKFVAGEVLVKFKPSMSVQAQQAAVENLGGMSSLLPVVKKSGIVKIKLEAGNDVMTAVQAYQADQNIEFAQPNYIYHAAVLPDDANVDQLWGLKNTGQAIVNPIYPQNSPVPGADIDAEPAWDVITDCSSAVVAVLDTGINYTHEDLAANMWDGLPTYPNHGFDFIGDGSFNYPGDNDPIPMGGTEYHGTHVAGTIGAAGNNMVGVTGVCQQASIMSVRVLGADGSGTTASISEGIEFAADNGADVINMSLGFESVAVDPDDPAAADPVMSAAISYAATKDVVISVAAGNGGDDGVGDDNDSGASYYPCAFMQDNLLCVAALDQSYFRASFSNYGAISVDVGAPGVNILSGQAGRHELTDDLSGWTSTGDWATGNVGCSISLLVNPSNYCPGLSLDPRPTYAADSDNRIYKTFNLNLSDLIVAELTYSALVDTAPFPDSFSTAMRSSAGDPFDGGTTLQTMSGSTPDSNLGYLTSFAHDISACAAGTCSLGFRLLSNDDMNQDFGVAIAYFSIDTITANSNLYFLSNGTSMASPHVAGIATMIRAFNPNYTYAQTVEAIKNGGEPVAGLSATTSTGRAANAMGALAYITQPTGLTAVVQ